MDFDIFLETWLIVFPTIQLSDFTNTEITFKRVIIVPVDELETNNI